MKYTEYKIVFSEIPDEIALAINISGCPYKCDGCHSPYLQKEIGKEVTLSMIEEIFKKKEAITCVCFMGGDRYLEEIQDFAIRIKKLISNKMKVGWYSGRKTLPANINLEYFDYIKLGPYDKTKGGLRSPTTNQRLYKIKQLNLWEK